MNSRILLIPLALITVGVVGCAPKGSQGSKPADKEQSSSKSVDYESNPGANGPNPSGKNIAKKATHVSNAQGEILAPDDKGVSPFRFREIKDQLNFFHCSGDSEERPFPAANGSGVGMLDYDNDGNVDLTFGSGTPIPVDPDQREHHPALFQNLGAWKWRDVSSLAHFNHYGYSAGVTVGDFDNDGFADVYFGCYGENVLFQNQGDGTFRIVQDCGADGRPKKNGNPKDVKESRGSPATKKLTDIKDEDYAESPGWATSVAFFDFDHDGFLDLYVVNYAMWSLKTNLYCGDREKGIRIFCGPASIPPQYDVLYRNRGDGTFEDVSESSGITKQCRRGQGVVCVDLNNDGWLDLYIGNDMHVNTMFLNNRNGTFTDMTEKSGAGYDSKGSAQASMGVDAADVDRDGDFDLITTNFEGEYNTFYQAEASNFYVDRSVASGLAAGSFPWISWGVKFVDFDLDGWLDCIITAGGVDKNRSLMYEDAIYDHACQIWHNKRGRFSPFGKTCGDYFETYHPGRGLAVGDLDNDGDDDVAISHQDQKPAILENLARSSVAKEDPPRKEQPNSTRIRLIGTQSNRTAIGSRLTFTDGSGVRVTQIMGGGSYASSCDVQPIISVDKIEGCKLEVRWPSGKTSAVTSFQMNGTTEVVEPRD
jgi:enediyne biosynthesis protein E4